MTASPEPSVPNLGEKREREIRYRAERPKSRTGAWFRAATREAIALLDAERSRRETAEAECEKWRSAARVLCGAHVGIPQEACPVCDRDAARRLYHEHVGGCAWRPKAETAEARVASLETELAEETAAWSDLVLLIAHEFDAELRDATWADIAEQFDPHYAVRTMACRLAAVQNVGRALETELAGARRDREEARQDADGYRFERDNYREADLAGISKFLFERKRAEAAETELAAVRAQVGELREKARVPLARLRAAMRMLTHPRYEGSEHIGMRCRVFDATQSLEAILSATPPASPPVNSAATSSTLVDAASPEPSKSVARRLAAQEGAEACNHVDLCDCSLQIAAAAPSPGKEVRHALATSAAPVDPARLPEANSPGSPDGSECATCGGKGTVCGNRMCPGGDQRSARTPCPACAPRDPADRAEVSRG